MDYGEVFAPVAMQPTLRVLLTVAGHRKYRVRHLDVKNAYLNGRLQEEIYMRQPPGYSEPGKEKLVCRLQRSLYGLKQAARIWNGTVKEILFEAGFCQSESDACLYSKQLKSGEWMYVLLHVDDMIVATKEDQEITRLENTLRKKIDITSLGEVSHFLGIKVRKDDRGVFCLSQGAFIREIASRFGLDKAKQSKYPLDVGYWKQKSEVLPDNEQYHSLVGALLYVSTNT